MNNTIASRYDILIDENNDPVHDPEPLKEYMDKWDGQGFINKMELNVEKSVLEIGVGTGRLAVRVSPMCKKFYGIDISPKTIERAKENLNSFKNIELICGDFFEHSFDRQFDVIYSSLTFMHISEKQKAFNLIADLLAPSGRFVLSIDKNQDQFIDTGTSKFKVYPDKPSDIEQYISNVNLKLSEHYEMEFAHIFVCEYTPNIKS